MGGVKGARQRVEAWYGAPIAEVLRAMRREELTQTEAAERLGVSSKTIGSWARRVGVRWAYHRKSAMALRDAVRARSSTRWVEENGERMTLCYYARRHGSTLTETTLRKRYDRGLRGADLLAPRTRCGGPKPKYSLGISERDWKIVLEDAEKSGSRAAALRYGVPYGAITAMQRGEEWRVC